MRTKIKKRGIPKWKSLKIPKKQELFYFSALYKVCTSLLERVRLYMRMLSNFMLLLKGYKPSFVPPKDTLEASLTVLVWYTVVI